MPMAVGMVNARDLRWGTAKTKTAIVAVAMVVATAAVMAAVMVAVMVAAKVAARNRIII